MIKINIVLIQLIIQIIIFLLSETYIFIIVLLFYKESLIKNLGAITS